MNRERILAYLQSAPWSVTCGAICADLRMHEKAVRQILDHLRDEGLVHSTMARGPRYLQRLFGIATRPLVLPEGFELDADAAQPAPEDEGPEVYQIHTPVGQWRADHIPAVRSVFDLGVGA